MPEKDILNTLNADAPFFEEIEGEQGQALVLEENQKLKKG